MLEENHLNLVDACCYLTKIYEEQENKVDC